MTAPRVPLIEVGANPALAPIEARIRAARGRISPLYRVLLHSTPVVEGWEALLTAIRQKTSVPPRLRELVILRVAVLNGAAYEFEAHVPHAQRAGIGEEQMRAVRNVGEDRPFDDVERLVLRLTDAMTRDIEVPDVLYRELETHFDPTALVEIVATVAAYNMVSRFLVALRIGH